MDNSIEGLIPEVVACREMVEDYAQRIDDACVEYYQSGKTEFPNLSRAEDEETSRHCEALMRRVAAVLPDRANEWQNIKYPIDQYKQMIERMRDTWLRRRNLLRLIERQMKTKLEFERASGSRAEGTKPMVQRDGHRVLIIHGHDELNRLALKEVLQSKLRLPEPVVMAQQMVPGAALPEKFEKLAASVDFAIALLTPDDLGRAVSEKKLGARPRQNTLVEIGWFWGRLGRERILLLVKGNLDLPSDLQGLEYYCFREKVDEVLEKIRDFFEAHATAAHS